MKLKKGSRRTKPGMMGGRSQKLLMREIDYGMDAESQLIDVEEVREQNEALMTVSEALERLRDLKTPHEVLSNFQLDATKKLVMMSLFNERYGFVATKEILDRVMGKPVERMISIGQEVSSYGDERLNQEILATLNSLKSVTRGVVVDKELEKDLGGEEVVEGESEEIIE